MAECAKISEDLEFDCDNVLQPGTEDEAVLINKDDWDEASKTTNMTNAQIIEDIVFASGARGYLLEGINNSILPKSNYIKGRFSGLFNHEVNYYVFSLSSTTKQQLEKKKDGKFVLVVRNKFKGSDSTFEIYGKDSGLIVPDGGIVRDPGDSETSGAYNIILRSDENSGLEPHLPATLFNTDYATTLAIFNGLTE